MSDTSRRRRTFATRRLRERRLTTAAYTAAIRRCCLTRAEDPHAPDCLRDRSMCGDKVGYASRRQAMGTATGMSRPADELLAYWCPVCELWHIGHEGTQAG